MGQREIEEEGKGLKRIFKSLLEDQGLETNLPALYINRNRIKKI